MEDAPNGEGTATSHDGDTSPDIVALIMSDILNGLVVAPEPEESTVPAQMTVDSQPAATEDEVNFSDGNHDTNNDEELSSLEQLEQRWEQSHSRDDEIQYNKEKLKQLRIQHEIYKDKESNLIESLRSKQNKRSNKVNLIPAQRRAEKALRRVEACEVNLAAAIEARDYELQGRDVKKAWDEKTARLLRGTNAPKIIPPVASRGGTRRQAAGLFSAPAIEPEDDAVSYRNATRQLLRYVVASKMELARRYRACDDSFRTTGKASKDIGRIIALHDTVNWGVKKLAARRAVATWIGI